MDTVAIKVATLKAVQKCKPLEQPVWPNGCTKEIIQELLDDELLEWKSHEQTVRGGWSTMPLAVVGSMGQFRVTAKGKQFIRDNEARSNTL